VAMTFSLKSGEYRDRDHILRRLVGCSMSATISDFVGELSGCEGDVIEIIPVGSESVIRIEMFGDEIDRILELDPITGEVLSRA
jgi:excinuclease ABC subunit B